MVEIEHREGTFKTLRHCPAYFRLLFCGIALVSMRLEKQSIRFHIEVQGILGREEHNEKKIEMFDMGKQRYGADE